MMNHQSQSRRASVLNKFLWALVAYFGVSAVTFCFIDRWWLGELPPLVLIQLPKIFTFQQCQALLLKAVAWGGVSTGSASPDYLMVRPYAFTLMYVLLLTLAYGVSRTLVKESCRTHTKLLVWVLVAAMLDFTLGLLTIFSQRGGYTIF